MTEMQKISTTRIAELAKIESKQLFGILSQHGWIIRSDNHWRLTKHGEFEGGSYQSSEKYGEYIVWPPTILENPIFKNIEEEWLSATKIAEHFNLAARQINSLLSELGWIDKDQRGWMIAERGKILGGEQRNGQQGFFVVWPSSIIHSVELISSINNIIGVDSDVSLDGHAVVNIGERKIDNWLYLHGIAHAYRRLLPGSEMRCTFYLPVRKIYIEYWGFDITTGTLSERLKKEEFYKSHGYKLVELNDDDMKVLDDVLPQKLLQFGMQVY